MADISIQVGAKFRSFDELQEAINAYEDVNFIKLYKRSSRSISAYLKRFKDAITSVPEALKFAELDYFCIYGGKTYTPRACTPKTKRGKPSSFECSAHVIVRLSKDRQFLVIKNINEDHSHEISEESYLSLPCQRKIDKNLQEEAEQLFAENKSIKEVKEILEGKSGTVIDTKMLDSIKSQITFKFQIAEEKSQEKFEEEEEEDNKEATTERVNSIDDIPSEFRLHEGAEFDSFSQLDKAIEYHEKLNLVKWVRQKSRTVAAHNKLLKDKIRINEDLQYSQLHYGCAMNTGRKSGGDTCPAHIHLTLTSDRQKLQVVNLNEEHNHEVSQENYLKLSHKGVLDARTTRRIECLIDMRVSKKVIQQHLLTSVEKNVSMQQIRGIEKNRIEKKHEIKKEQEDSDEELDDESDIGPPPKRKKVMNKALYEEECLEIEPDSDLRAGAIYTSNVKLEEAIERYQQANFVQFYKRSSRTIQYWLKKFEEKEKMQCHVPGGITLPEVDYWCIHGGKTYKTKSKSTNNRRSSTFLMDCKAFIQVRLTGDKQHLVVRKMIEDHCHPCTEDNFRQLPQQRKLSKELMADVERMLYEHMKIPEIQQQIHEKTGKPIQIKDISNIKGRMIKRINEDNFMSQLNTVESLNEERNFSQLDNLPSQTSGKHAQLDSVELQNGENQDTMDSQTGEDSVQSKIEDHNLRQIDSMEGEDDEVRYVSHLDSEESPNEEEYVSVELQNEDARLKQFDSVGKEDEDKTVCHLDTVESLSDEGGGGDNQISYYQDSATENDLRSPSEFTGVNLLEIEDTNENNETVKSHDDFVSSDRCDKDIEFTFPKVVWELFGSLDKGEEVDLFINNPSKKVLNKIEMKKDENEEVRFSLKVIPLGQSLTKPSPIPTKMSTDTSQPLENTVQPISPAKSSQKIQRTPSTSTNRPRRLTSSKGNLPRDATPANKINNHEGVIQITEDVDMDLSDGNIPLQSRFSLNSRRSICGICNRRFLDNDSFQAHLQTHLQKCDFLCSACDRTFLTHRVYKRHGCSSKREATCLFRCTLCKRLFGTRQDFSYHFCPTFESLTGQQTGRQKTVKFDNAMNEKEIELAVAEEQVQFVEAAEIIDQSQIQNIILEGEDTESYVIQTVDSILQ